MQFRLPASTGYTRYFFLLVFMFTIFYTTNVYFNRKEEIYIKQPLPYFSENHSFEKSFEIYTPTCQIPHMSPFDPLVMPYVWNTTKTFCSNKKPLVISNDTHLILNKEAFPDYNIKDSKVLECYYEYFWRDEPNHNQKDNKIKYGHKIYFDETALIDDEFLRLKCLVGKKVIYTDFYAFVPIKEMKPKIKSKEKKLNVLIVGLDSVSRLNFHRQMPLTNDFLKNGLGGIEYFGYNKIGDNTFPNLVPVLTGLNEEELKKTCWPTTSSRFDNCTFLWKDFHDTGYVTAFAEEANWMGLFNYLKQGFIKQPVTHMWGVLDLQAEKEIGYKGMNSRICMTVRLTIEYLLEYNLRFIRRYKSVNQNYFGLFWESSISHDTINYDPKIDRIYTEFLKKLVLTETLDDTILFFMSDHGIRWGKILETFQGRLEERLPFFFVVVPKWFKKKYPEAHKNLVGNARRLTSHWDLRETMLAVVESNFSAEPIESTRGISLFRPVPLERTCETADIPIHWCTCQKATILSTSDKLAHLAVHFIINHINYLLSEHIECAKVILDQIQDATSSTSNLTSTNSASKNHSDTQYISVVFRTKFVGAIFESTVKCTKCDSIKDFEMAGPISRNNQYGHQGDCIKDAKLRLYCYCKM